MEDMNAAVGASMAVLEPSSALLENHSLPTLHGFPSSIQ